MFREDIIRLAKALGIDSKPNSDSPGLFITNKDRTTRKIEIEDLFPELRELEGEKNGRS